MRLGTVPSVRLERAFGHEKKLLLSRLLILRQAESINEREQRGKPQSRELGDHAWVCTTAVAVTTSILDRKFSPRAESYGKK